ncbi:MAG: DUF1566 domain-containing protein [Candidatus Thiodiazotropha sp.]
MILEPVLKAFSIAMVVFVTSDVLLADTKVESSVVSRTRIADGTGDFDTFDALEIYSFLPFTAAEPPKTPLSTFPLETGLVPFPWEYKSVKDEFGTWSYANQSGRVRTRVRTGIKSRHSQAAGITLTWGGLFIRDSAQLPTFTLNPSWLEVRARQYARGPQLLFDPDLAPFDGTLVKEELEHKNPDSLSRPLPPFAEMTLSIFVSGWTADWQMVNDSDVIFHHSRVSGIAWDPEQPTQLEYAITRGWYDKNYDWISSSEGHPAIQTEISQYISDKYCVDKFKLAGNVECFQEIFDGYHYEIGPYTGRIDLDSLGIKPGDTYGVYYLLKASAGEDQVEQFAEAFLADPLDSGTGGLTLESTDTTVKGSTQLCKQVPDPEHFVINGDGTATDQRTGLMWQRCPHGMTLNDQGNTDPDDDSCTSAIPTPLNWQTALQAAASDSSGGYTDWELPDVKALESLVLPDCMMSAADRLAFPDTPSAAFWSSTPIRQDPVAWQVDFYDGDINWAATSRQAYVRLVRDSGTAPSLLRPAITIEEALVEEGAAGATKLLRMPVRLSRPIGEAVTLSWATQAVTATEGVDYQAASGVLTIPADTELVYLEVPVIGDRLPEGSETFNVNLSNPSANAHLAIASAHGTILDDEPSLRASVAEQVEGDAGSSDLVIRFYLDRPAADTLSFNYVTADVTATAGTDYVAKSGTVLFNPAESSAEIRVTLNGDVEYENDEQFELLLDTPDGLTLTIDRVTATIVDDDGPGTFAALNDTGITHCATATEGYLTCPQAGLPLQDGDVGRDITDPNPDDGDVGFSFTKLAADGSDMAATAFPWSCVRDEVTGLVWENKSSDMTSPHYDWWTYTWRNDSGVNDGGDPGVSGGGDCLVAGTCDTQQYIDEMNATALCGFTDWRLPSVDELFTLSHNGSGSGHTDGVDGNYFRPTPDGDVGGYWSSTPGAGGSTSAWVVQLNMFGTRTTDYGKGAPAYVRLVRGGVK